MEGANPLSLSRFGFCSADFSVPSCAQASLPSIPQIPFLFPLFLILVTLIYDANAFNLYLFRHKLAVLGPDLSS